MSLASVTERLRALAIPLRAFSHPHFLGKMALRGMLQRRAAAASKRSADVQGVLAMQAPCRGAQPRGVRALEASAARAPARSRSLAVSTVAQAAATAVAAPPAPAGLKIDLTGTAESGC